jgi:hypothetical protein
MSLLAHTPLPAATMLDGGDGGDGGDGAPPTRAIRRDRA